MNHKHLRTLAAVLASCLALALAGCGGGKSPTDGKNTDLMVVSATLTNAAGQPTILDVVLALDRVELTESCPAQDQSTIYDNDGNVIGTACSVTTPLSAVAVGTSAKILPGTYTLSIELAQTTSHTTLYTVPAFKALIYDPTGKLKTIIALPAKTANLKGGDSIDYTLSY